MNAATEQCRFASCDRRGTGGRGWCPGHYRQWREGGELKPLRQRAVVLKGAKCTFPDCERPRNARGLCKTHYVQLERTGELREIGAPRRRTAVNSADECADQDCRATPKKRGFCERHYRQARRRGEAGWNGSPCAEPGCEAPALTRGLCGMHYGHALKAERGSCSIEDCDRTIVAKGWCSTHYGRYVRHGDPLAWKKPSRETCFADECDRSVAASGLCDMHYRRLRRYGSTEVPPEAPTEAVEPAPYTCKQCGSDLPKTRQGRRAYCSDPCKEAWNYWDRRAKHRERWLKKYDMTVAEYDAMLAAQGGGCAICGSTDPKGRAGSRYFHVDHCHSTGQVRGLLCAPCNLGLGAFRDQPDLLISAIDYLKAQMPVTSVRSA